jgi:preprotein translocase subunit SecD
MLILPLLGAAHLTGGEATAKQRFSTSDVNRATDAVGRNSPSKKLVATKGPTLKDGLYLILRQDQDKAKLEPTGPGEEIVINDFEFLHPSERESAFFIVVSSKESIPFKFSTDPARDIDEKGRTKLLLQLAEDQIKPLERFTSKNCGKSVAIIIGGKVATTHKIREAIKGGKLQITRCSDFGCDVLYTELLKDSK